jgi:hypothetical protein
LTLEDTDIFYDLNQMLVQSKSPVPPELARHEASKFKPGSVPSRHPNRRDTIYASQWRNLKRKEAKFYSETKWPCLFLSLKKSTPYNNKSIDPCWQSSEELLIECEGSKWGIDLHSAFSIILTVFFCGTSAFILPCVFVIFVWWFSSEPVVCHAQIYILPSFWILIYVRCLVY